MNSTISHDYIVSEVLDVSQWKFRMMMENHNLRIADQLGTQQHEARLLKTICLWNFKNIDRRNGNVPRSMEAIAGAVYGQQ